MYSVLIFFVYSLFSITNCLEPISPCNLEDEKCVTDLVRVIYAAVVPGVPELGIAPSDPMHQKFIEGELPTVKYSMTNSVVYGYKDCKIENVKLDKTAEKSSMVIKMLCPFMTMNGTYEIDGNLGENLPVKGKGDYDIESTDYHLVIYGDIKSITKDSNRYIYIEDYTVESELLGTLKLELHNLFDGDTKQAAPIHKFIKENQKLVASLLDKPVFKTNIGTLLDNFNKQLKAVPVNNFISA